MKSLNSFAPLLTRPSLRDEIDAEMAARSLREFVRQAWPIVEPSTPFVPGWHIDAIIEHLEAVSRGQIRNLLINVPPRHMKSLLVSNLLAGCTQLRVLYGCEIGFGLKKISPDKEPNARSSWASGSRSRAVWR
jgi:hypothetical protein